MKQLAALAAAALGCLLLAGCGNDSQPAPQSTAATTAPPVRTLYVQAPLRGPAADAGRAMVDAVRLIVDQHGGLAGPVHVVVRTLDDGGAHIATDAKRCAANARAAAADPDALAVIGTYELSCSRAALDVLRPAGLLLVSPVNAAGTLPGALRLAPSLTDQGSAAAQLAHALGATRIATVSENDGAGTAFAEGLAAGAPSIGAGPVTRLDASTTSTRALVSEVQAARTQLVALAGSPGTWATDLLRALSLLPPAARPAVVAPESFDTLAFLDEAGAAAEGIRVISRFVPAEELGGSGQSFAGAYANLHGEPPPVAAYAAEAASAVLQVATAAKTPAGTSRAAMAHGLLTLPAHDGLLGNWAATPTGGITPRHLAVLTVTGGTFRVERVVSVSDPLPPSGDVQ